MRKTLCVLAFSGSALLAIIGGCGNDDSGGGEGLPPRNTKSDGGETNTSSSSGSTTTDAGKTYDCTSHKEVDPKAACNSCTLSKCCKELTDCENDQACLAAFKCVSQCPDCDEFCALSCGTSDLAIQFGGCISNNCSDVCTPACDAGFDSPF